MHDATGAGVIRTTPGGFLTPPVHLTEFFDLDPTPVDGCSVCKEKAEDRRRALDAGFMAVAACAAVEIGRHPGHRVGLGGEPLADAGGGGTGKRRHR